MLVRVQDFSLRVIFLSGQTSLPTIDRRNSITQQESPGFKTFIVSGPLCQRIPSVPHSLSFCFLYPVLSNLQVRESSTCTLPLAKLSLRVLAKSPFSSPFELLRGLLQPATQVYPWLSAPLFVGCCRVIWQHQWRRRRACPGRLTPR
jgi:hypothetical protein